MNTKRKREAVEPPTEERWNFHKDLLRQLYFDSTLPKLMQQMEREHNFVASKNQYERKLREEWQFRKNLTADEREYALRKIHEREHSGKKTRVALHGLEISENRFKKEKDRYTLSALNKLFSSYPTAPSPEAICVSTPSPGIMDTIIRSIRIDNLPCFRLVDFLAPKNGPNPFSVHHSETRSSASSIFGASPRVRISDRSIASFEHNDMTPRISKELSRVFGDPSDLSSLSDAKPANAILHQLRHMYKAIERFEGETDTRIRKLFGPSATDALSEFINLVIELSSNNMLSWDQTRRTHEWIVEQSDVMLQKLFKIKLPSVKAYFEYLIQSAERHWQPKVITALFHADVNHNLYRGRREELLLSAIRLNLAEMVRTMLEEGIDANIQMIFTDHDGRKHPKTLLGAAKTAEIATILLEYGANVNAGSCYDGHHINCRLTPIYSARIDIKTDLFRVLIDAGASFDPIKQGWDYIGPNFLAEAVEEENIEFLNLLLQHGAVGQNSLEIFSLSSRLRFATVLQQASYLGFVDGVEALLQTPSDKTALHTGTDRWAPLRDAAKKGHLKIVELLIDAGADVDGSSDILPENLYLNRESFGLEIERLPSTALMAAIEGDHIDVVEALIYYNVDINAPAVGTGGTNVLEVAEALGNHDIIALLVKAGAEKSMARSGHFQIFDLWLATIRKDIYKIHELLWAGVYVGNILDAVNVRDGEKVQVSEREVLSTFMEVCGHDINARGPKSGLCALELVANTGNIAIMRELVCRGAKLNALDSHGQPLVPKALSRAEGASLEDVEYILRNGAVANSTRWQYHNSIANCYQAIEMAVSRNDLEMVQLLRRYGVNVDARRDGGDTALQRAVRSRDRKMVIFLLDNGADINARPEGEYGRTALQAAAGRDCPDVKIIQLLLDKGADINAQPAEKYGRTALQAAAGRDCPDVKIIQLLLDKGADINAQPAEKHGRTALQAAVGRDCPDVKIIQLLLDKGADINAQPAVDYGMTALQGAAINGHLKIAHILLEKGANPNAPGSQFEGRTALEGAAEHGRLDMVQLLLNAGARPSRKAIRYAEYEKYFSIADIIKAAREETVGGDESEEEDESEGEDESEEALFSSEEDDASEEERRQRK